MAIGKKTGGRNIQKGQRLPGAGRPKTPPEIRQFQKLTSVQVTELMMTFLSMEFPSLVEFVNKKQGTALEMITARILLEAIKNADTSRLEYVLSRTIGKMTERLEVAGNYHVGVVDFIERMKKARETEGGS